MESWSSPLRVRSSWLRFIGGELALSGLSLRLFIGANTGMVRGYFNQEGPFLKLTHGACQQTHSFIMYVQRNIYGSIIVGVAE